MLGGLAVWCGVALAADAPGWWWSTTAAVALQPSGLLSDNAVEYRAPILRYGGALFNDTFAGAGARLSVSPAHAEAAARLSLQPVDVLPLRVEVAHTAYWRSPFGLIGYTPDQFALGTDGPARNPRYRAGEGFGGSMWSVIAAPTAQARVGPVVGFSAWTLSWVRVVPARPFPEPWFFEPYRGLVLARQDLAVEHTSAILGEPMDGEGEPLLRVGGLLRGKWARDTPDVSLQAGVVAQYRPDDRPTTPTLLMVVAPYLRDPDFVGPIPFWALAASWQAE